MKKISFIFLVLAYFFSFYVAYIQTDFEENEKIKNIEKSIGREFVIPNSPALASQEELYPILYEAANESKVNILRTGINYKENDEVEIFKFILLTTETHFFNNFNLNSGRFLTIEDTRQSNSYLSTVNSGDRYQIGEIRDFGDNNLITIKPLKSSYDYFPVYGTYYVEASDDKAFNEFINVFVVKVNKYYGKYNLSYTAEDFAKNLRDSETHEVSFPWISILKYQSYINFVIAVVLLIYYIFNESKRIGILKMHGVSNIRLWFIMVGKLITSVFIFSIGVSVLLAILVKNTTYIFIYNAIFYQFIAYVILITISLISYVYILRIKVVSIIKNCKDTNSIFALNILIKMSCSVIIVLIGLSTWVQYTSINNKQNDLKNWKHSKDYGVFYPLHNGYDGDNMFGKESWYESTSRDELYFILNKMGAILIDSLSYEEKNLLLNKNWKGIKSIKVNNNYLQEFPIYDINNRTVQVPENTSNWVLLVPEKYHNKEEEIRSFFLENRKNFMEVDQEFYQKAIPDSIKNQNIDIIWLKNDQRIFSFNPKVFPSENNSIVDPIIQVVTEKNSLLTDRGTILGQGPGDPLKIKLINRDPMLTYKMLEPQLKKLKVDDNLKHLITIDQYILQEIYQKQSQMKENWLTILGLISALMLLVVQNLIIFFNKNQRKFIVHRLFGIGFFKTYKEYTILFSMIWVLQILICCIVNRGVDLKLFAVAAMLLFIEITASVIALMIIEKKNKVKVLKGGI